ncbi:uncharacterized protein LOC130444634 [Diorhabda sublineata]|uniref:uncharacterized protein LOC130444634 n=1 Tax=Diorhabda sublineata TaxID=1163346 RepID=UPI0024E125BE|nr:uncharacterized protein LOC130444634 [Diorhabda sublineata]XP_056635858.1 uncharacterized protein LOC130444634 [Diorhabda sublineata]
MFSSPAVQIYLSENAENNIQRKPVPHQLTRKPFIDRSVNGKSSADKIMKSNNTMNKDVFKQKVSPKASLSQVSPKEDLNGEDFMFSGKDVDDLYDDVWPPLHLGKEGIIKILRDYSFPKNSPPPSVNSDFDYLEMEPVIDSDFLELVPNNMFTIDVPMLLDESFEVELPQMQSFEDFDTSY